MLHLSSQDLDKAVECLRAGHVIVFPTETSYGIGCDATNDQAVARVFNIKQRTAQKGTPVLLPNKESVDMYVEVSQKAQALIDDYWPGALNLILPAKEGSAVSIQCAYEGMQAVRLSSHPFCAVLARRFGKPIVATSANLAGQDAAYSTQEVHEAFEQAPDKPDCIIDGGLLAHHPASTTAIVKDDQVEIVRQGIVRII